MSDPKLPQGYKKPGWYLAEDGITGYHIDEEGRIDMMHYCPYVPEVFRECTQSPSETSTDVSKNSKT